MAAKPSYGACKSQPKPAPDKLGRGERTTMDQHAARRWHERRESLFPTKLPYSAVTAINAQLPKLDEQKAMDALESYSRQKPYRGFYMLKFMVHYERAAKDERRPPFSGTESAQEGASAPSTNDMEDDAHAERHERERYESLPNGFRTECETRYAEWGWPKGSRGWRLLCLDAFDGRDVERYRRQRNIFTMDIDREREMKDRQAFMERRGYIDLIEKLRHEIRNLGGNVEIAL